MTSNETVNFKLLPSMLVNSAVAPAHALEIVQRVEPSELRFQTITTTSESTTDVSFSNYNPQSEYLKTSLLMTCKFNISVTATTVEPAFIAVNGGTAASINGTPAYIFSKENAGFDSLALNRMINNLDWTNGSYGTLSDTVNTRSPLLQYLISLGYDVDRCKEYGINPMDFLNQSTLSTRFPSGSVDWPKLASATATALGCAEISPFSSRASSNLDNNFNKFKMLNSPDRVTWSTSTWINATSGAVLTNGKDDFDNDIPKTAAGNAYYGLVTQNFTISLSEYLICPFFTSMYESKHPQEKVYWVKGQTQSFTMRFDQNLIYKSFISSTPSFNGGISTKLANFSISKTSGLGDSSLRLSMFNSDLKTEKSKTLSYMSYISKRWITQPPAVFAPPS